METVVTGMGAISSLGVGCGALWQGIARQESGIRPIQRFSTQGYSSFFGASVPAADLTEDALTGPDHRNLVRFFCHAALHEARVQAGFDGASYAPQRVALVLGTSLAFGHLGMHELAENLGDGFGIAGPRLVVSTACSSSTNALGHARDLLAAGTADVVFAGGVDVLNPEVFAGFHALGVLNPEPCSPFSRSIGTTLGEGAGFLVLEPRNMAVARGATVQATLSGYGLSGDAFHETSPDPGGAGVGRALSGAIQDAGLKTEDIDYINAHGSGTAANDPAEWAGITKALGSHAGTIPVSSVKGILGHAQGAAGALEAIVSIMAMNNDVVPPSGNFSNGRTHGPTDPVCEGRIRAHPQRHIASLNSAFGGSNAAVVFSSEPLDSKTEQTSELPASHCGMPLHVLGVGAVGPFGFSWADFQRDRLAPEGKSGGVPPFQLTDLIPSANPRGLDPASCYLSAAAAMALSSGGIRMRGSLRNRSGLLVGTVHPSAQSMASFAGSIRDRGLDRLSATAFARIVLNAPAGTCSKLLALKGPNSTLSCGPGSGLMAIVLAAELVARRSDTSLMMAGGMDELPVDGVLESPLQSEGAGCVLLGRQAAEGRLLGLRPVQLKGWAIAGPGQEKQVRETALKMGSSSGDGVKTIVPNWAGAEATSGVWAFLAAVDAIGCGELDQALVVTADSKSSIAACYLTA